VEEINNENISFRMLSKLYPYDATSARIWLFL